jgi:hypothetical protein
VTAEFDVSSSIGAYSFETILSAAQIDSKVIQRKGHCVRGRFAEIHTISRNCEPKWQFSLYYVYFLELPKTAALAKLINVSEQFSDHPILIGREPVRSKGNLKIVTAKKRKFAIGDRVSEWS